MILVLARHAARESFSFDDGISEAGRRQAETLGERIKIADWFAHQAAILSSPKKRCLETSQIVGKKLGLAASIEMNLDEARANETVGMFTARIQTVFVELALKPVGTLILVSHSDWLEEAAYYLFQGRPSLRWSHAAGHVVEYSSQGMRYLAPC